MRRARTIIGLPIISLAEGLRVGHVRDLVFDPGDRSVVALVVSEASWRHDAELVPIDKVRNFGRDAVTIFDLDGLIESRTDRDLFELLTADVKLDGLLAMTDGGNFLGAIEEVMLGPRGEMLAYEISAGFTDDVHRGKCLLPANEALTVGHDVATFPDGIEALVVHPSAEVEAAAVHEEMREALGKIGPAGQFSPM
ncbi:MAG TPA: PRC-barrel domain-containing protein, partial [Chloroflexota bacterium]|nr:PRC-barrel domain-containing protein [Chloroflexota bacterium]